MARTLSGARMVPAELASFHHAHRHRGDDGLGERGQEEDRILSHGPSRFAVREAGGAAKGHLAVARHQDDHAH